MSFIISEKNVSIFSNYKKNVVTHFCMRGWHKFLRQQMWQEFMVWSDSEEGVEEYHHQYHRVREQRQSS